MLDCGTAVWVWFTEFGEKSRKWYKKTLLLQLCHLNNKLTDVAKCHFHSFISSWRVVLLVKWRNGLAGAGGKTNAFWLRILRLKSTPNLTHGSRERERPRNRHPYPCLFSGSRSHDDIYDFSTNQANLSRWSYYYYYMANGIPFSRHQ